jgi:hypothetical protein
VRGGLPDGAQRELPPPGVSDQRDALAHALHMSRGMTNTAILEVISLDNLANVCGGAGGAPHSGDVTQQINTNWGGTQIINPPQERLSPLRFEQLRQNPALRHAPPPYKPMPIRRR